MRGGGKVFFDDEVGNELVDLLNAHLARVALVMIDDKLPYPVGISFFGAAGVLFDPQSFAVLVEEFFALGRFLRCVHFLDFWRIGFYNSVHKLLCGVTLYNTIVLE